jgi:hypothetical protein
MTSCEFTKGPIESASASQQVVELKEGVVGTDLNHPPRGPEPSTKNLINASSGVAYGIRSLVSPLLVVRNLYVKLGTRALADELYIDSSADVPKVSPSPCAARTAASLPGGDDGTS